MTTTWSPRCTGSTRLTFQTVDVRIDIISHETVAIDDASTMLKSDNTLQSVFHNKHITRHYVQRQN